ncbi:hypothetical protein SAMN05444369_11064 [Capnocytophaga haemolytica]|jgi:hypothetical protein|uniref:Uncharacterized protein n=1 Tax=Capnocytophaga haemolytica TaxID=45243 RepID=A0AAX2GUE4_9FLAO|nr:hypothetical protein [Capnocytophaga haemolytica]AMD85401.1 hypothetical protein AXF12_07690 [Capnocytophaga haemolytica]SFO13053.1 hypothetical protein SAMN05444369_11064 [Capnocytophaga haemolytica]SNV02000.1 Uncharacterised protein [Capnocytophaga haemolytica]
MSIFNLNNLHLTKEQIDAIDLALTNLEKALEPVNINLTSEDRKKYGRVNEQNKLFILKVLEYAKSQPTLRTSDVNWEEFERDFESRAILERFIGRLESLTTRITNAKTLHDYDNYQESLEDYAYTSFRAKSKAIGYEDKHRELAQFFAKGRKNAAKTPNADANKPNVKDNPAQ